MRFSRIASLLLVLTVFSSAAWATVMVPLSLEDLSARSKAVVRGKVLNSYSAWDEQHDRIYTYTEIQVLESLHGSCTKQTSIVVRVLGGEVGEIGMKVSGTSRFKQGEEVVLFLRQDPIAAQQFMVVGMSQGKYRIQRDKDVVTAVPGAEGIAFARADPNSGMLTVDPNAPPPGSLSFAEMKRRVSIAIKKNNTPPTAPDTPSVPVTPVTQPQSTH